VNYWFSLRTDFQKALGETDAQFRKLRPDLRSFYGYMLRLTGSAVDA
jgi:hypothetical protein